MLLGDPGKLEWDMARYRDATVATVKQAVARYLDTKNRLLVRFRVEKSGRASEAALDRSKEPASGADKPFQAPKVETAKLPNGMDLFVVERPELPKVAITFVTRAGAEADPAGKAGLAQLTVTQLDMGTPTRKALEIEDALGDLGVAITGAAGRESARVSFEVLKRNLDPAMAIVADVIRNASYPASEFDREKKRHLDTLAQQEKNANAVGARVRAILAFGPDHPYGRPVQGLPSTIEKLTREDLAKFHADVLEAGLLRARRLGRRDARRGDRARDEVLRLVVRRLGARRGRFRRRRPRPSARSTSSTGRTRRRPTSPSSSRPRSARLPTTTR